MTSPVTKDAAGDARKIAAPASPVPGRNYVLGVRTNSSSPRGVPCTSLPFERSRKNAGRDGIHVQTTLGQFNGQHLGERRNSPPCWLIGSDAVKSDERAERRKIDDAAVARADHGLAEDPAGASVPVRFVSKDARPFGLVGFQGWALGRRSRELHKDVDLAECS